MAEDELKLRRQAERGARAKAIVEDPLVKEVFDNLEREIIQKWKATEASNVPQRERYHALMTAAGALQENLEQMIRDGRMADTILAQPKHPNRSKVA